MLALAAPISLPMNRRLFLHSALGMLALATRLLGQNRSTAPRQPEPWRLENESALGRWRAAVRRPVIATTDAQLRLLAVAVHQNRRVRFRYIGGSECGSAREVTAGMLYTVDGFDGVYLSGYCHSRQAERTFLVTRMNDLAVASA